MKNKISIIIVLLILNLVGCKKTNELETRKKVFKTELLVWKNTFVNFELKDFSRKNDYQFENIKSGEFTEIDKFYSIYKPIITFSEDKTKFIDIYSSQLGLYKENGKLNSAIEVDQQISLVNLKNKTWNRILFLGSSSWIDEIIWLDNKEFMLVGVEEKNEGNKEPIIYIGDISKNKFEVYKNTNKKCFQKENGYESKKLKNIKFAI